MNDRTSIYEPWILLKGEEAPTDDDPDDSGPGGGGQGPP